jgi:hypothetical protein
LAIPSPTGPAPINAITAERSDIAIHRTESSGLD